MSFPKRPNETTHGNKAGYNVSGNSSVPKISVKLLHTVNDTLSLNFLGKICTTLPQRVKEKLNINCRATRYCCLWGSGNTRILQSFTTWTACSHYQTASNLQEEMQSVRCYDTSGIISNEKTKEFIIGPLSIFKLLR